MAECPKRVANGMRSALVFRVTATIIPPTSAAPTALAVTYELTVFADFLVVSAVVPVAGEGMTTSGLCGAVGETDFVRADGLIMNASVSSDAFAFGESWRVEAGN